LQWYYYLVFLKNYLSISLNADDHNSFSYLGTYNVKLVDKMTFKKYKSKDIIRMMNVEGRFNKILFKHILQHDKAIKNKKTATSLLRLELKMIRRLAKKTLKNSSK